MFIKQVSLLFILLFATIEMHAQGAAANKNPKNTDVFDLIQDNSFGGTINLYQNPSLHVLLLNRMRKLPM